MNRPGSKPAPALISIVIPVTEAELRADELVEGYGGPLRAAGYDYEFVFVLDSVGGRAEQQLVAMLERHPLKVVRLQGGGLGESIALSAGVARASGEFVINAPQYLQSEPGEVVKVVQALESGADVVATRRYPRVDPWINRLQSRLFNWVLRVLMGIKFHDLNSSLRGLRRNVLDEVSVYGELYRFLPVLAQRQGFRVVEVPVRHREERGRRGFFGFGVYLRRMLDILAITFLTRFTQKPLRFFGMLGFLLMLVGGALCVEPLIDKIQGGTASRPILVLGAILVAFGFQLIGFGLVGEIIIFTQASSLRDFKVDEVLEHDPARRPKAEPEAAEREPALLVREVVPGEDARWDAAVHALEGGTFFHLSGWRKVVEDTFGHEPVYLVAERGREWQGLLPLFWVKSPFLGKNLISTPYGVYGGALSRSEEAARALLDHAESLGRRLGAGYLELRQREPSGRGVVSDLYVTFERALPKDPAEVLPAIPKKARAEVRRARDRFALGFEASDDLRTFFRLFEVNKRRLGSPSLPRRWFRGLVEEFGQKAVLHVARTKDGAAIAAVMSFCFKDVVYAYYSGALHRYNRTGVNDFVYCKLMEWCVEQGFKTFDFGRSRRDTGTASFKRHMGFAATPLSYEYVLLKEGASVPAFHPSNPRLDLPRRLWARLPLFLASRLGGRLSRYIP